jgi:hypothetical protein
MIMGAMTTSAPALAAGDLLVAPTRVVLDGARGTEVILNNIGSDTATYRISLELKRMNPDGSLDDVDQTTANEIEKAALAMITYAPRRVTLPPNVPQSIRIGIRPPQGLPDGEYRAHMLFRAIPESRPVVATPAEGAKGVSIALTPIYGVTIPIIVRQGSLKATAAISGVARETTPDGLPGIALNLERKGVRSTFGRIRILDAGGKEIYESRGIAVYPEVGGRKVSLPLPPEVAPLVTGSLTIQYLEEPEAGGALIAETRTVLR